MPRRGLRWRTIAAPSTRPKMLGASCLVRPARRARRKTVARGHRPRPRSRCTTAIAATLEYARGVGMPLAIEPLHPMQGAERACVNALGALDICDALDVTWALGARPLSCVVGSQARRADRARDRLLAYHVRGAERATSSTTPAQWATASSNCRRSVLSSKQPATPATSRWRSSPTPGGAAPPTRFSTPAWRATRRWCDYSLLPTGTMRCSGSPPERTRRMLSATSAASSGT